MLGGLRSVGKGIRVWVFLFNGLGVYNFYHDLKNWNDRTEIRFGSQVLIF